jgi:hypothetical protein
MALLSNQTIKANNIRLRGLIMEELIPSSLETQKRKVIQSWLEDTKSPTLQYYISAKNRASSKTDRYGRLSLFPVRLSEHSVINLQDILLETGLARANPASLSIACARRLLKKEEEARRNLRGLWAQDIYKIKSAKAVPLSNTISTYQLIKGTIVSLSRNPNKTSYLNFGHNWKTDFTVTLSARNLKLWEQQGHSLDELKGQTVYVRGWIENRDGALIRIRHPQQLQYDIEDLVSDAK